MGLLKVKINISEKQIKSTEVWQLMHRSQFSVPILLMFLLVI
jgi:hypothetical protein